VTAQIAIGRRRVLLYAVGVLFGAFLAAAPARAEILFQEDFEDGNLSARGWFDVARWGTELFLSTTEHRTGTGSLEVRYQVGSTGPWMRHGFPGRDRVYTRYYRKWAANWRWNPNVGPHDTYLFGMYGQQWFAPTQTYVTVYTEAFYQGLPGWQPGSIGLTTRRYLQGESYRTMTSLNPPPRYQLDRWYCVETLATMNAPGSSNGSIQVWVDGAPMFDVQNLVLRDAANATLTFDQFMWGPYYHGGAPQVQSSWIDALVVATERVGCLGAGTDAPSAPGALRTSP
jgi:hypothetical protein